MDIKQLVLILMPISALLDDFLERYEYINIRNPKTVPDLMKLMNDIQKYVNNKYESMGITKAQWNELIKELPNEKPTTDNDQGTSWFRKNDLGNGDDKGQPTKV